MLSTKDTAMELDKYPKKKFIQSLQKCKAWCNCKKYHTKATAYILIIITTKKGPHTPAVFLDRT